jgi:hypothetical protein
MGKVLWFPLKVWIPRRPAVPLTCRAASDGLGHVWQDSAVAGDPCMCGRARLPNIPDASPDRYAEGSY